MNKFIYYFVGITRWLHCFVVWITTEQ